MLIRDLNFKQKRIWPGRKEPGGASAANQLVMLVEVLMGEKGESPVLESFCVQDGALRPLWMLSQMHRDSNTLTLSNFSPCKVQISISTYLRLMVLKASLEPTATTFQGKVCFFFLNLKKKVFMFSPGGSVVKNPPADAGDKRSTLDPGRSHMLSNNKACTLQLLSMCS